MGEHPLPRRSLVAGTAVPARATRAVPARVAG